MRHMTWVLALALCGACGGDGGGDGGIDAGQDASAPADAGLGDAGAADAGAADAGPRDGGPTDAGPMDGGTTDAGTDSGLADGGTTDAGTDSGLADGGIADAGDDSGVADGGIADGGIADAGADGGIADAGIDLCTVTVSDLGIPADSVGDPTLAHHPDGVSLIVWNDLERGRTFAILRRDNGTISDLGDLGNYASVGSDLARPSGAPAVLARSGGFSVVWQETYRDSGGFTQYRFRERSVTTSGTLGADSTTTPGLRIGFTDVNHRLFDVGADLIVFRGRTGDTIPETRTVFNSTLGRWSIPFGGPEQVAYDGTQIAIADREGDNLRIRLFAPDGTEAAALVVVRPVPSESNRLRIEAIADGWLIVDRNTLYTVSDAGVVSSGISAPRGVQTLERGDAELLLGALSGALGSLNAHLVTEAGASIVDRRVGAGSRIPVDAAVWTGTQWLVTYVEASGLEDQAVLAAFCEEDRL